LATAFFSKAQAPAGNFIILAEATDTQAAMPPQLPRQL